MGSELEFMNIAEAMANDLGEARSAYFVSDFPKMASQGEVYSDASNVLRWVAICKPRWSNSSLKAIGNKGVYESIPCQERWNEAGMSFLCMALQSSP